MIKIFGKTVCAIQLTSSMVAFMVEEVAQPLRVEFSFQLFQYPKIFPIQCKFSSEAAKREDVEAQRIFSFSQILCLFIPM